MISKKNYSNLPIRLYLNLNLKASANRLTFHSDKRLEIDRSFVTKTCLLFRKRLLNEPQILRHNHHKNKKNTHYKQESNRRVTTRYFRLSQTVG